MDQTAQTLFALGIVGAALAFLLWRWFGRRRGSACDDGDCGCSKGALKKPRK
jgi:hypothetical protein